MFNKNPLVFFKTIFDLYPDPTIIVDKKKYVIKLCNTEFQNLFKKSNDYLSGKLLDELFKKEFMILSNIKEANNRNENFVIKDKIKVDSSFYEIKCIVSEEIEDEFVMIFSKIENKENIFLSENLDFFNEMFSIISHEINNPLSSIKLASDLIKKRYLNVDSELLEIIKSEALRINRLFSNFTKTDSNQLQKKNAENIHELIRLCLFKIKQMPNDIKILEEFDPSLPTIRINRDLIMQAFDNLLINSYESSNFNENSFLRIRTRFIAGESIKIPNLKDSIKKNSISITFSGNGKGISKEILKKVFLPFFSTKQRGSGIGLFLVKKIIDDHDGSIEIQSINGLTSVEIQLPF